MAKALSGAADELIANGDHAKIFGKWGVGGIEITKPVLNPPTSF
jgi:ABC-type amino acid transport substrate-binding protein